jgi:hypothetical protein
MSSTTGLCRYTLLLVATLMFSVKWGHLLASPLEGNCSDVCTDSSDCGTSCLIDYDTGSTCGDYGVCYAYSCSSTCGSSVDCSTQCYSDGDTSCAEYDGGQGGGQCYGTCGDSMCQGPYETCSTCSADCGSCPTTCPTGDPTCSGSSGCSPGDFCDNGCCVALCVGNSCDNNQTRSCDDETDPCDNNGQSCTGEVCYASITGGVGHCYNIGG